MRVGDKVVKRTMNGAISNQKTGIIKKVGVKWRTALVYWKEDDKEFWHCWDDLRVIG